MIILRNSGYGWALMSNQFTPFLAIEHFQALVESTGNGFQWYWKSPENPSMFSWCSSWIFHGIDMLSFMTHENVPGKFMYFSWHFWDPWETSVDYKLKVILRRKKRKDEPWKFHSCWIRQWHPQKQNFIQGKSFQVSV